MAYGKSKDLVKIIQSDKVLRDKAFQIASDPKYDGYQRWLASMVYKFFDKNSGGSSATNEPNYQLVNELHQPIIKKFKERTVYSSFRGNIWGFDLADMQSLSKYNKGIKCLLCAILKRKGDKLYVKWKGYDSSFNSWIDKKDFI